LSESGCLPSGSMTSTAAPCSLAERNFDVRIDGDVGGLILLAAEVAGGFLDKGYEGGVQRQVVGDVVEARGEDQHASLADLLFEQQRSLVGEAGDDAGLARIDAHHLIKLHTLELVWRGATRDARIGGGNGLEAILIE